MPGNVFVLSFNRSQLNRMQGSLEPKQYERAMYSGLKRATSSGKTLVSTILRDYSLAKKKYLDDALSAAVLEGNPPSGKITIYKSPLPLSAFKYSKTSRGIRAQMTKDVGPQWFTHAFIARMKTGHVGIFMRDDPGRLPTKGPNVGKAKFVKGTERPARFTIKELFGPSAYATAKAPRVYQRIEKGLRETLTDNIEKQVRSQISRFAGATLGYAAN